MVAESKERDLIFQTAWFSKLINYHILPLTFLNKSGLTQNWNSAGIDMT